MFKKQKEAKLTSLENSNLGRTSLSRCFFVIPDLSEIRKVAEFLAQDVMLEWRRTWIALLSVQFIY